MKPRDRVRAAVVALVVVGSGACGSSSRTSSTPITVFNLSADPSQNVPVTTAKNHAVLTVAQVRSTLDSLLSKHTSLVAALVDKVVKGDTDTAAAVEGLTANAQALTNAIAVVYGSDAARAFAQLWAQHTQFFIDYASAARAHDGGAKRLAESRLLDYQNDFSSFVNAATAGGAPLAVVTALLHRHVHDVIAYIDADVSGRGNAGQVLQQAVAHMHEIATAVADAIAAQHLTTVIP